MADTLHKNVFRFLNGLFGSVAGVLKVALQADRIAPDTASLDLRNLSNGQSVVFPAGGVDFSQGVISAPRFLLQTNPTHEDTFTYGGDTYQFIDEGTSTQVTDDSYIAVTLGANVNDSRTSLLAAINNTADAEHATITLADGTTPAIGVGSEAVKGSVDGVAVVFASADEAGGTETAADPNKVLAEGMTAANNIWDVGSVNVNTLSGQANAGKRSQPMVLTVNAGMVASGSQAFLVGRVPFTIGGFVAQVWASDARKSVTDTFEISSDGKGILVTFAGGTHVAAGDVIRAIVWEA